jgi:phenylalanyl-tRNA synthetase beta chain
VEYAGLRDHVFDVNVTPDKGFALSIRGMARELAIAFAAEYTDPADTGLPADTDQVSADVYPASIEDPTACDRFVLREVHGIDTKRPTPLQMRVRLARAGTRTVSLAVDITNYLMLELGQPLHAFDRDRLQGPIVVRRARPGERLETLDHVTRELDPDDIHPDHRRLGPDLHGRHHGRPGHRDHRGLTRRGDRGCALRRGRHRADEPQAPAVL